MRLSAPLREIGNVVGIVVGAGDVGVGDGASPAPRRGPAFLAVQTAAMILVVGVVYGLKALLVPAAAGAYFWALAAFLLAVPLILNWFAAPPRRTRGLLVAVLAGGCAGGATVLSAAGLGPVWSASAALAVGYLVAAVVFGALAGGPPARRDTVPER